MRNQIMVNCADRQYKLYRRTTEDMAAFWPTEALFGFLLSFGLKVSHYDLVYSIGFTVIGFAVFGHYFYSLFSRGIHRGNYVEYMR